jgi:hypothetical protein
MESAHGERMRHMERERAQHEEIGCRVGRGRHMESGGVAWREKGAAWRE